MPVMLNQAAVGNLMTWIIYQYIMKLNIWYIWSSILFAIIAYMDIYRRYLFILICTQLYCLIREWLTQWCTCTTIVASFYSTRLGMYYRIPGFARSRQSTWESVPAIYVLFVWKRGVRPISQFSCFDLAHYISLPIQACFGALINPNCPWH